jgi:hypothetical protein
LEEANKGNTNEKLRTASKTQHSDETDKAPIEYVSLPNRPRVKFGIRAFLKQVSLEKKASVFKPITQIDYMIRRAYFLSWFFFILAIVVGFYQVFKK